MRTISGYKADTVTIPLLSNNYYPPKPSCTSTQAVINFICQANDVADLSSRNVIFSNAPKNAELQWHLPGDGTVRFLLKTNFYTDFAFGIGTSMTNSDVYMFRIINDNLDFTDRYSTGHSLPDYDMIQSVTLLGYKLE